MSALTPSEKLLSEVDLFTQDTERAMSAAATELLYTVVAADTEGKPVFARGINNADDMLRSGLYREEEDFIWEVGLDNLVKEYQSLLMSRASYDAQILGASLLHFYNLPPNVPPEASFVDKMRAELPESIKPFNKNWRNWHFKTDDGQKVDLSISRFSKSNMYGQAALRQVVVAGAGATTNIRVTTIDKAVAYVSSESHSVSLFDVSAYFTPPFNPEAPLPTTKAISQLREYLR